MHASLNKDIASQESKYAFLKNGPIKLHCLFLKVIGPHFMKLGTTLAMALFFNAIGVGHFFAIFFAISGLTSYQNILLIV